METVALFTKWFPAQNVAVDKNDNKFLVI